MGTVNAAFDNVMQVVVPLGAAFAELPVWLQLGWFVVPVWATVQALWFRRLRINGPSMRLLKKPRRQVRVRKKAAKTPSTAPSNLISAVGVPSRGAMTQQESVYRT